jgi:signal peptidase II
MESIGTGGTGVYYILLVLAIIGLDQYTKYLVVHKMSLYQSIPVIDHFFYITSHRNRGAAFGILQNQQTLFIAITILVILFLIYYMVQNHRQEPGVIWAFSFILGGAIGNLIDRIRIQEVVDFFHFQFGNYHFPIFNVADAAICVGVGLMILVTLFSKENSRTEQPVTPSEES